MGKPLALPHQHLPHSLTPERQRQLASPIRLDLERVWRLVEFDLTSGSGPVDEPAYTAYFDRYFMVIRVTTYFGSEITLTIAGVERPGRHAT